MVSYLLPFKSDSITKIVLHSFSGIQLSHKQGKKEDYQVTWGMFRRQNLLLRC